MTRDRSMTCLGTCTSNDAPEAITDRAWKLRPVIDPHQARFKSGYVAQPVMGFDDAAFEVELQPHASLHERQAAQMGVQSSSCFAAP
ncbi:unnamed protein product [Phytophthora fragariaefolia]|uniref:Unnamed protein product n=1 Tax=Phytophthora fragariaefolia TaxID=1490495 RepID=A0A9W6TLZ2_9STRA|nr:unnamed protein product [Phytophthora fragariaefolia]